MSMPTRRGFLTGAAVVAGSLVLPSTANSVANAAVNTSMTATKTTGRAKHVVLVDWDGFDPDYLSLVDTPNLDALAAAGSFTVMEGSFPTISNPSRASMSTGAWPEVHGNVAGVWDPVTNKVQGQDRFLSAETIAQVLAGSGRTLASVQWYMVQNFGATYGDPEHLYVQPGGTIGQRTDVAINILNKRAVNSGGQQVAVPRVPDFLAVYSSDLDGLGHAEGDDAPGMAALMTEHDRQLGRLIQATKDVGIFDDTAFIVTGDHGMSTWSMPIGNKVLDAVTGLGYRAEFVTTSASPDTEVVLVVNGVLNIYLRGRAVGAERRIKAAIGRIPEVLNVFDRKALDRLHASDKLGNLIAEAKEPYGFSTTPPAGTGIAGVHGTTREITIPLFLAGAGVGRKAPRHPEIVDIAPTIAALLSTRAPADSQGRVLREALRTRV